MTDLLSDEPLPRAAGAGGGAATEQPEPRAPRRIAIVGCAGAGKSTLAGRIAARLGVPHIELDAIYHRPNWTPLERDALVREVSLRCAAPGWVIDGNYSAVRPLVWARADLVVWLDLPRWLVMRQVIKRSVWRVLTRAPLWNGNRERPLSLLRWDPKHSIIRWAWTQHASYVARYAALMVDPAHAGLPFQRLRSHAQSEHFLRRLEASLPHPAGSAWTSPLST